MDAEAFSIQKVRPGCVRVTFAGQTLECDLERTRGVRPGSRRESWWWPAQCPLCSAQLAGFRGGHSTAQQAASEIARHLASRHHVGTTPAVASNRTSHSVEPRSEADPPPEIRTALAGMESTFRDVIMTGSQQIAFLEDMKEQATGLAELTGDITLTSALHDISVVFGKMGDTQEWNELPERDRREDQVELARKGLKSCRIALSRLRTLDEL